MEKDQSPIFAELPLTAIKDYSAKPTAAKPPHFLREDMPSRTHADVTARPTPVQAWLSDLNGLLVRFSDLGIGGDINTMGLRELRGIYCFLLRLSQVRQ